MMQPPQKSRTSHLLMIAVVVLAFMFYLYFRTSPQPLEGQDLGCAAPLQDINGRCCRDDNYDGICDDEARVIQPVEPAAKEQKAPISFPVKSGSSMPNSLPILLGGKVGVDDDPSLGTNRAPAVVIEFANYDCPPCLQSYIKILPLLQEGYIGAGKVMYVFRDFPFTLSHTRAYNTAIVAACAREQGKFWEMHDLLFTASRRYTRAEYVGHAAALNLDLKEFHGCIDDDVVDSEHVKEITHDYKDGRAASIEGGAPTFFVNGYKVSTTDYKVLQAAIENVLSGAWA